MTNNTWDAIVIGAGLGGMTSAAYLSALGKRTLLLERHSVLGGSSHVFRRKKQWEFDCGVHYIGDCGPGGQVPNLLRGLGLDEKIEWLPMDQEGFDTIIGPDLELKVPVGWDHYLENLLATFPDEEKGVRFYVAVMRRLGESLDRSLDVANFRGIANLARKAGWAAPWMLVPHARLLQACRFKPSTVMALSVEDGALTTLPMQLPCIMAAGFLGDYVGGGSWYPKGGGQILSAAFADVIQTHGGQIRTQAEVASIDVANGKARGVTLAGGETLTAPIVVAAGDVKRTYRELLGYDNLPRRLRRRCDNWKMTQPLINACFGVEIDIQKTPNSNYFAIPNWDMATDTRTLRRRSTYLAVDGSVSDPIGWAKDYARNQPAFVQCSTRRDPSNHFSAPAGHAAIEVQSVVPSDPGIWGYAGYDTRDNKYRRSSQYQDIKQIITEGFLDRLEQVYPGAADKVKWCELGTPASQERFTHTSNGSAFGLEPNFKQVGPLRPTSRTHIKGLYLAGTSTAWGPATVGAMLSGLHAAAAATGVDIQSAVRDGQVFADKTRLTDWGEDFDPYKATRMIGRQKKGRQPTPAQEEKANAAPMNLKRQTA